MMINTLLAKIGMGIVATATVIAGWLGVNTQQLGSTVPLTPALFETSLASPISISDLSMTLAKGTLLDGTTLSGYTCFTVDSGQPNLEYICGTASGTAITSLIRGVNPLNGTTSVAALTYSHRRGANVKVTDYPALSIQGRILSGLDGIPAEIRYDNTYSFATSSNKTLVDKGYVDGIAIAGSPIMTTSVQGIGKLSTASASSTNPIVVGDNDTRVPTQSENDAFVGSTGTPSTSNPFVTLQDVATTTRINAIVRASSTGLIDRTFLPTVDIQTYSSAGTTTWTKPSNAKWVEVTVIGAGGGGSANNGTSGGGGGGGWGMQKFNASALSSTETVVVGAGGTTGITGGTTYFGTTPLLRATGGTGGTSGAAGTGGSANGSVHYTGGTGGYGSPQGNGVDTATDPSPRGGGSAGYDGGTPTNAVAGGNGGSFITNYIKAGGLGGTTAGTAGAAASTTNTGLIYGGVGGGGSGRGASGSPTNVGGNGNLGSGGGAGNNGSTGGTGGDGLVVVVTYF